MTIAVLFALPIEAKPFLKIMEDHQITADGLHTGRIGQQSVTVTVSGMGSERSTSSVLSLLSSQKYSAVISAGLAGALSRDVQPGDVVICRTVVDLTSLPYSTYDLDEALLTKLSKTTGMSITDSRLITAPKVMSTPFEKEELGKKFNGVAVDMESAPEARVARAFNIPFIAVRAIADAVEDFLPAPLANLLREDGSLKVSAIPGTVLGHPSSIYHGIRLQKKTNLALKSLVDTLTKFIPTIAE